MALKEDVFAATFAYASRIHSKCRPFSKNKCNISNNQAESGSRNGIGCCQMSVPDGVVDYDMTVERVLKNSTGIHGFNHCDYSFLAESYHFHSNDIVNFGHHYNKRKISLSIPSLWWYWTGVLGTRHVRAITSRSE